MATCPRTHRLTHIHEHTNKPPTACVQLGGHTSIIGPRPPTTRHIVHRAYFSEHSKGPNIRNTTLVFVTGQIGAPNEILSMGPRVRRDATELDEGTGTW